MSIVNGSIKQYTAVEYILKPKARGSFTLPPATAIVNGNTFRSNSLPVIVKDERSGNATSSKSFSTFGLSITETLPEVPMDRFDDYILYKEEDIRKKVKTNLFLKVDVSKTTCYVGEPIVATYKLYTRLKSESNLTKSPSFNGFSVSELEMPDNTPGTEKYNGKEYSVYTLRKAQLYPLQPGNVELEPIEVENEITFIKAEYASRRKGDIFYDLLRNFADAVIPAEGTEKQKITLQSKSVGIVVKELPADGKPQNFKGAVGNFSMHLQVQKDSITTDEAGNISVIVSGSGNLQMVNAPKIYWPAEIEAFEPVSTEHFDHTAVPLKGQKIFNYPFTASQPGKYIIPSLSFSYFDSDTKNYKIIATAPVAIIVTKEKSIKTAIPDKLGKVSFQKSQTFMEAIYNWRWQLLITAIIVTGGLVILLTRRHAKSPEPTFKVSPLEAANQGEIIEEKKDQIYLSKNPLMEAEQVLIENNGNAFYYILNNCLRKYLSIKLGFPEVELTKKKLGELLDSYHVGLGTTLMLSALLEKIEVNLYAPPSRADELQQVYEKASEVISLLDKQIS